MSTRPFAVITGASSGIGASFARQLAARGYDLLLVARRVEPLRQVASSLERELKIAAEAFPADLATDADVQRLVDRIGAEPRLEMLVNNAGFGTKGKFFEADVDGQDQMHRLHVMATMRLSHAALRAMVRRGRGAIINVSSVAGFLKSTGNTSYCATKAWMNHFTEGLYLDLKAARSPVKVQALCPGYTLSGFHDVMGVDRGRIPKHMWMDADFVVAESLRGLDRNRLFVIPGWKYRWAVRILPHLPRLLLHRGAVQAGKQLGRD